MWDRTKRKRKFIAYLLLPCFPEARESCTRRQQVSTSGDLKKLRNSKRLFSSNEQYVCRCETSKFEKVSLIPRQSRSCLIPQRFLWAKRSKKWKPENKRNLLVWSRSGTRADLRAYLSNLTKVNIAKTFLIAMSMVISDKKGCIPIDKIEELYRLII